MRQRISLGILLLTSVFYATAQAQINSATGGGAVKGTHGGANPGAAVSITNQERLAFSAIAINGLTCTQPNRDDTGQTSSPVTPPASWALGATSSFLSAAGPEGWWRLNDSNATMVDFSHQHINGGYVALNVCQPPPCQSNCCGPDPNGVLLNQPSAIADDGASSSVSFDGYGFAGVGTHKVYSLTRAWDSFDKAPPDSGWGPSNPESELWTPEVSDIGYFSITPDGRALIDPLGQSGSFEIGLQQTTLLHGQMQIRGTWTQHAVGGALQPISLVAQRTDNNNMVRVELIEFPDTSLALFLIQVVNGQNIYLDTQALTYANCSPQKYTVGDWWWLRFEFDGPKLSARAWKDGTLEPQVWQATGTAKSANVGSVAVRSANSVSSVRPQVYFDDFWVQTIGFSLNAFIKIPDPSVAPQPNNAEGQVFPLSKASHYSNAIQGQGNQEYYFRFESDIDALKAYAFNVEGHLGAGQRIDDVQFNKWYHVVMELDPGDSHDTNAGVTMYVDGKYKPLAAGAFYKADSQCTTPCENNRCMALSDCDNNCTTACVNNQCSEPTDCWLIDPMSADAPLQFAGGESGSQSDATLFVGSLQDIAMYPRKLSCDEVTNIYNSSCQPDVAVFSGLFATASSSDPLHPPTAAIDGQNATYWSSATVAVPQFFRVDLGTPRDLSMIRLYWKDFPATFQAFISTDGTAWTQKTGVVTGQPGIQQVTINDNARFIHLNLITPSASAYSLAELQIFPCGVAAAACTNQFPVAVVGPQERVYPGKLVQLDGSNSFDPDFDVTRSPPTVTYSWTLNAPTGSHATLSATNNATPQFTPDMLGTFSATLVVTDFGSPAASSYPATTVVTVLPVQVFVTEQLTAGLAVAARLSPSDVTSPRDLRTFIALLSDASAAVQAGTLDVARHKIERAIIRTNGWSLRGRPDAIGPGKDWILAKDLAMQLYTLLKDSLAAGQRDKL